MYLLMLIFCLSLSHALPNTKINTLKKYPSERIIGGQEAFSGQFPFAAAIYTTTTSGNFFCGGTLLNNQWILSAGQCVDGVDLFDIRLGSISLKDDDPNSVRVSTETYILHPDYDRLTLDNDLGLIRLRLPVEYSDYLKPIEFLPSSQLTISSAVKTIGWGQTSDSEPGLVNILRHVFVTVLSNEECQMIYGHQITDNMVCVDGNYNQGTCIGDSGGPLIQFVNKGRTILVGVSSFLSHNGCESTDPSGFVRVLGYNDWIRNITGRQVSEGRIYGGTVAIARQCRYCAAIYKATISGRYFCGGTLFTDQWILTAGQCVDGGQYFEILLGSQTLSGDSPYAVRVSTEAYVLHPDYDSMTLDNDVGLIKLRLPVQFSDYLRPVDLLPLRELRVSSSGYVYGWGHTGDNQTALVNDLHYVSVIALSNEECRMVYGNQISDNMLCAAGYYNEGTCVGDTGSPLIQYEYPAGDTVVVAIVSFFSKNGCESIDPSGFIRVYGYNDWIRNITGKE